MENIANKSVAVWHFDNEVIDRFYLPLKYIFEGTTLDVEVSGKLYSYRVERIDLIGALETHVYLNSIKK